MLIVVIWHDENYYLTINEISIQFHNLFLSDNRVYDIDWTNEKALTTTQQQIYISYELHGISNYVGSTKQYLMKHIRELK